MNRVKPTGMALIKVLYSYGGTGILWRSINCSEVKILPKSSNTDRIQFKLLLIHLGEKRDLFLTVTSALFQRRNLWGRNH